MSNTKNYNLKKPSTSDNIATQINVDAQNNLDVIDEELYKHAQVIDSVDTSVQKTLIQSAPIFTSGVGKDTEGNDNDVSKDAYGHADVVLEGFTAVNLIKNGDFSNGSSNWTVSSAGDTLSISNGVATLTGGGNSAYMIFNQDTNMQIVPNKKMFLVSTVKAKAKQPIYMSMKYYGITSGGVAGTGTLRVDSPILDKQYKIYDLITLTSALVGKLKVVVVSEYIDKATENGGIFEVSNVMAIDLTSIFGAGNEPTKEQCNYMFDHYIDGLQGVGSGKIVSVGKNIFDGRWESGLYSTVSGIKIPSSNDIRTIDFVKVKPNTNYIITQKGSPKTCNVVFFSDKQTIISFVTQSIFTTPSNCMYVSLFYSTGREDTTEIQVVEGTTPTAYEPHKSSSLITTLPTGMKLHKLPNGVTDSIQEVNNEKYLFKRTKEYVLQASDITIFDNATHSGIVSIAALSTSRLTAIGASAIDTTYEDNIRFIVDGKPPITDASKSDSIGGFYASKLNGLSFVLSPTITTLSAAQTALAGTKIVYQLATPITYKNGAGGFSQEGSLEVYPGGTIYQEPTTLKESTYAKTRIMYNLSNKAVLMQALKEITKLNNSDKSSRDLSGWKIYSELSQLGLSVGTETMEAICAALPDKSMFIWYKYTSNASTAYPASAGTLLVTKINSVRTELRFTRGLANKVIQSWIGGYDTNVSPVFTGWHEVGIVRKFGANSDNTNGYLIQASAVGEYQDVLRVALIRNGNNFWIGHIGFSMAGGTFLDWTCTATKQHSIGLSPLPTVTFVKKDSNIYIHITVPEKYVSISAEPFNNASVLGVSNATIPAGSTTIKTIATT